MYLVILILKQIIFMGLNLLSYNPTGVIQDTTRCLIADMLGDHNVQFAFLQETWLLESNAGLLANISN